ncbi:MAG: periplasmic heavy metal sensor [Acidobacteriota bacterium]
MTKRNLTLAVAAILAVVIAVPFAYAQHMRQGRPGHRMGPRGGDLGAIMMLGHLEQAKETLGLSDQQVDQIKGIFKGLHEQNAASRDELHGSLKSVAEILIANPNDVAAAQAALEKQEAAEHTMKVNALNAAAKALNVLTADQRAALGAKVREHGRRFEK